MQLHRDTAYLVLFTYVFSCLYRTVSPPSVYSSPVPTLMVFIGGAVASDRASRASEETCGHCSIFSAPCATFIENAIQVGHPHSLQFFFGNILKI